MSLYDSQCQGRCCHFTRRSRESDRQREGKAALLPFTRCLAGPTDFTPAIFNFSEVVKGTHPHSTLTKQLAEFVVIYSPLQMAADAIENYEGQPALTFIESCPTTWSKTLVPNGEIGKYITVARKERNGNSWFVGSNGPDADYESNPYPITIRQETVNSESILHLSLARSGGTAIRILDKGRF